MKSKTSEMFEDGKSVQSPSAAASLRDALRIATAEVHERLHHHIGFAAVQAGTIDHGTYALLLSRPYGFYRPFEATAELSPERTRWLESDLTALNVDGAAREKLPRCSTFPSHFSPDHILGARYVVEGSALGGRGMARQLDALLGPQAGAGRHFFSGHGAATGVVWREYLALLSAVPSSARRNTAIIDGANATFALFEQWLAGWNNNHD
ncbi:biliverdin-producing heme oxygenase [Sphingomonas oligophenolica]|nr:biliverdin-producing heme oxygenase [Sphingomonas oligophenolica]